MNRPALDDPTDTAPFFVIRNITPEQTNASPLACHLVNKTFLALDGFRPMRNHMDQPGSTFTAQHFAAYLARLIDREMKHFEQDTHAAEVAAYLAHLETTAEELEEF